MDYGGFTLSLYSYDTVLMIDTFLKKRISLCVVFSQCFTEDRKYEDEDEDEEVWMPSPARKSYGRGSSSKLT